MILNKKNVVCCFADRNCQTIECNMCPSHSISLSGGKYTIWWLAIQFHQANYFVEYFIAK